MIQLTLVKAFENVTLKRCTCTAYVNKYIYVNCYVVHSEFTGWQLHVIQYLTWQEIKNVLAVNFVFAANR